MSNGGSARPQSRRRTLWVMAGISGALAMIAVLAIFFLPKWMYGSGAEDARATLQGGLLTAAAAFVAVAGGLIALDETRQANSEVRRANENTHVRELYTSAIELLGHDSVDVRLGGLYALERIANDSPPDQRTVVEVLSAYVREHTRLPAPTGSGDGSSVRLSTDVQAALTVLGRLPLRENMPPADLRGANLSGAQMRRATFIHASMGGAVLVGARLGRADLRDAWLDWTNLVDSRLNHTNLAGARLNDANLTRADLRLANLAGANLMRVQGLTQEQVDSAFGDRFTVLPDGLTRPARWTSSP